MLASAHRTYFIPCRLHRLSTHSYRPLLLLYFMLLLRTPPLVCRPPTVVRQLCHLPSLLLPPSHRPTICPLLNQLPLRSASGVQGSRWSFRSPLTSTLQPLPVQVPLSTAVLARAAAEGQHIQVLLLPEAVVRARHHKQHRSGECVGKKQWWD